MRFYEMFIRFGCGAGEATLATISGHLDAWPLSNEICRLKCVLFIGSLKGNSISKVKGHYFRLVTAQRRNERRGGLRCCNNSSIGLTDHINRLEIVSAYKMLKFISPKDKEVLANSLLLPPVVPS